MSEPLPETISPELPAMNAPHGVFVVIPPTDKERLPDVDGSASCECGWLSGATNSTDAAWALHKSEPGPMHTHWQALPAPEPEPEPQTNEGGEP